MQIGQALIATRFNIPQCWLEVWAKDSNSVTTMLSIYHGGQSSYLNAIKTVSECALAAMFYGVGDFYV